MAKKTAAKETFEKDGRGRTIFPLKHVVEFGGETVETLSFRRPKGKDIKKLGKAGDEMDAIFNLFGDLSEREAGLIEEFDIEDVMRLELLLDDWGVDLGN